MKRYLIILSCLFLFASLPVQAQDLDEKLDKEEMQKDLSILVDHVLKLHPTIGVNIKQEE
jgi:hypothetical protein